VIILGVFLLEPLLGTMNLPAAVHKTAFDYLAGLSYGILPLFLFNVLRSFIYALGKTRIVMVILLLSLPFNFFLNYVLIFGYWGFPELGGAGAGYATSLTYWLIAGMTVLIVKTKDPFSSYSVFADMKEFSLAKCKEILKIGVPMGLSTFFETSMFAVVTILLSKFNVTTIAAYQSALNIVSFLYMIPISISMAQTVLVGYEVGSGRYKDAKAYSWLGIYLAILIALVTGLLVVIFRFQVAGLYSNEVAVINLTAHFLIYALFFQISDAIQATAQAALRGYKDVNIAFIMTLVAYWLICLPVGYVLATYTSLGATGYWLGLTAGLLAARALPPRLRPGGLDDRVGARAGVQHPELPAAVPGDVGADRAQQAARGGDDGAGALDETRRPGADRAGVIAGRVEREQVVEGGHAVDPARRQAQRPRDVPQHVLGEVAEDLLGNVQDLDEVIRGEPGPLQRGVDHREPLVT
jgi:MATE family multidrug resistance protein